MSTKYFIAFDNFFSNMVEGEKAHVTHIYDLFDVSEATVKKYLKQYIDQNKHNLLKIVGFYPDIDTIISIAEEQQSDSISPFNLFKTNKTCKSIIDSLTLPIHEAFLSDTLSSLVGKNGKLNCKVDDAIELIYNSYGGFITESGNSLISIAGRMNEEILLKGLESIGLKSGTDFTRTGTKSDGDLKVFFNSNKGQDTLYVEVKSYHARERFLRALRDIPHPSKIGIGFFINPREFNPSRSKQYAQVGTWAIYLPDETYNQLDIDSLKVISQNQSNLYRPFSRFCEDMKTFTKNGKLPEFHMPV